MSNGGTKHSSPCGGTLLAKQSEAAPGQQLVDSNKRSAMPMGVYAQFMRLHLAWPQALDGASFWCSKCGESGSLEDDDLLLVCDSEGCDWTSGSVACVSSPRGPCKGGGGRQATQLSSMAYTGTQLWWWMERQETSGLGCRAVARAGRSGWSLVREQHVNVGGSCTENALKTEKDHG